MSISRARARAITARFSRQNLLIVGDLMLDHYIQGQVSRISPEAPVPVLHVTREHSVPGGACNVAANVRALGGGASVAGVVGRDAQGQALLRLLKKSDIGTGAVLRLGHVPTTVKTRIVADRQQVVRVDWEKPTTFQARHLSEFSSRLDDALRGVNAVIIEDYGKGVVQQPVVDALLAATRRKRIVVGLDPKDNYDLQLDGLTLAKPNRKEAFAHAGMKDAGPHDDPLKDRALLRVADILLEKWKPRMLMVTLGGHGLLLAAPGKPPRHVPTRAREVFDLSGAGDTVIATCMLALAAGADFESAAELANYAAGVVVGKLGTATCSREELIHYIQS
ncbi:MAG TPA: PfkB family carbohydrate kinase [Kiritimatiellia bacterium]|nr:PfkB family carbohydrate kinase [Kiritimatiellia bacterium]